MRDYVNSTALQEYTTKLVAKLKTLFPGTPTAAATVADMTDHSKTYVYVGTETGYTAGDWYYWDGSAWTSGGPFQATALITDTTLAVAGEAADAKATGDAIAVAKAAVLNAMAPAYSPLETYAVGAYVNQNGAIYRCTTPITTAEAWTAGHWAAVTLGADLGGQVSDLKTQLKSVENALCLNVEAYLYKKNKYINPSNVETDIEGYDLYRFPIDGGNGIIITWDANTPFWGSLNKNYAVDLIGASTVSLIPPVDNQTTYFKDAEGKFAIFEFSGSYNYLSVCCKAELANTIRVLSTKIPHLPELTNKSYTQKNKFICTVDEYIAVKSDIVKPTGTAVLSTLSSPYYSLCFRAVAGSKLVFADTEITGLTHLGSVFPIGGTTIAAIENGTSEYNVSEDCIIMVYEDTTHAGNTTYYPGDGTKIEARFIVGEIPAETNPFDGLNALAFGTSLTQRAKPGNTGGYLNYLPQLSGMGFTNMGVGNSTILTAQDHPDMLATIKGYTSYANKDFCILEGFVNDWYNNSAHLGTWKDTAETTVCGCVRSALNYILTQKPGITLFLILDHYGQGICASTEVKDGLTQYEFYEEIAKVAESLSVPVIKLYEKSGMSEKTPYYFLDNSGTPDNIHPSTLGAEQTANTIWSVIKQYYPKVANS